MQAAAALPSPSLVLPQVQAAAVPAQPPAMKEDMMVVDQPAVPSETPKLGKRRGRASEGDIVAANKDLIVSGKRSRRKVDKSADFLMTIPKSSAHEEVPKKKRTPKKADEEAEEAEQVHNDASSDAVAKREALSKRKEELEAYLKRLQVALAAERKRTGLGAAEAESLAATALPGGDKRGSAQRRRSSGASKVRKILTKTSSKAPSRASRESSVAAQSPVSAVPEEEERGMDAHTVKLCLRVVDDLLHNQHGAIFGTKVDWMGLNLPTYPQIVKRPMDLGTVRSQLTSCHYNGLDDFAADVQLIWDNAKLFNAPKSFVYEATLEMDRIWQRKYANLMREKRRASKSLAAGINAASATENAALPSTSPTQAPAKAVPKNRVRSRKKATALKKTPDQLAPMSLEEKAELRESLVNLPTPNVGPILAIMRESSTASASEGQEEIEIDVSALDTVTARKLQHYLRSIKPSRSDRPVAPARKSRPSTNGTAAAPAGAVPGTNRTTGSDSESDLYSDSDSSSSSGFADLSSDDEAPMAAAPTAGTAEALPPSNSSAAPAPSVPSAASVAPPAGVEEEPKTSTEDVQIENTDAWSSLAKANDNEEETPKEDAAWSDFNTKAAQNRQRERELEQLEDRRRAELQRLEAERAEREQKAKSEREADEAMRKQEAEQRERERLRQLEQEREAARQAREQEMDDVDDQAGAVEEFQNLMSA